MLAKWLEDEGGLKRPHFNAIRPFDLSNGLSQLPTHNPTSIADFSLPRGPLFVPPFHLLACFQIPQGSTECHPLSSTDLEAFDPLRGLGNPHLQACLDRSVRAIRNERDPGSRRMRFSLSCFHRWTRAELRSDRFGEIFLAYRIFSLCP